MSDTERESDVDAALEAVLALHALHRFFRPPRPLPTASVRRDLQDILRRLEDGSIPLTEEVDPTASEEGDPPASQE